MRYYEYSVHSQICFSGVDEVVHVGVLCRLVGVLTSLAVRQLGQGSFIQPCARFAGFFT